MSIIKKVTYFVIRVFYLLKFTHLKLYSGVRIRPRSIFGGYNKVGPNSFFSGEIGRYSYIGGNSVVKGKVGNFCSISHNVTFLTGSHPVRNYVSTHPAFYSLQKQCGTTFVKEQRFNEIPRLDNSDYSIEVGNDVLIGFGATLVGPLRIGNGAIIGANSVVTKDVLPYEVVVGSPARTIRKRFDDETIRFLEETCWWDKDKVWLEENADAFSSIEAFKKRFNIHQ